MKLDSNKVVGIFYVCLLGLIAFVHTLASLIRTIYAGGSAFDIISPAVALIPVLLGVFGGIYSIVRLSEGAE